MTSGATTQSLSASSPRQVLGEPRVRRVEQSVEVPAAPSNQQYQFGIERSKDPAHGSYRHLLDPASFEQRDLTLTESDPSPKVALPKTETQAKCPCDPPDPDGFHHVMLAVGP